LSIDDRNVYLSYYAIASLPWVLLFNRTIWRYIGILFIFFISVYAEKRGGFLALIFAISIFYSIESYVKRGAGLRIFYLILVFGFLYIVMFQLVQITDSSILERLGSLKYDEGSGRIDIYEDLISSIKKFDLKTLFFGGGHNSTAELVGTFAHNEFLQILVDYGIVGLFIYIYFHLILIMKSVTLIRKKSIYASSFIASYIVFLTIAMVSHWFVMAQFVIVIASYWGVIFALTSKRMNNYS
jgi:O-antigen ligase